VACAISDDSRYGGLILTHDEICQFVQMFSRPFNGLMTAEVESDIAPTWTAIDSSLVQTAQEIWGDLANEGWRVDVSSIFRANTYVQY
jgi:hypothetical protein